MNIAGTPVGGAWLAKEGGAFLFMGAEPLESLFELCGVGPRERCHDGTDGGPLVLSLYIAASV